MAKRGRPKKGAALGVDVGDLRGQIVRAVGSSLRARRPDADKIADAIRGLTPVACWLRGVDRLDSDDLRRLTYLARTAKASVIADELVTWLRWDGIIVGRAIDGTVTPVRLVRSDVRRATNAQQDVVMIYR
jgi:hypothetical protein